MSASRNLPLYLKLAAPIVVLAALFAVFVQAVWGPQLLATQRALLLEREHDVIRNVAPTLQIDLLAFDFAAIFETLRRVEGINADERMTVELFNATGRRLYPLAGPSSALESDERIELRQPIEHEGKPLGELVLRMDITDKLADIEAQIQALGNLVLAAGAVVLVLAIASYYWLIGRPLTTLAGVAARLGEGDFAVEIPQAAVKGSGVLGEAVVRLRESLSQTRAERDAHSAQLAASLVRYRTLQDSMPGALLVLDRSGRIEEYSGAAEDVFGYRREDMVGQRCDRLFPDVDCQRNLALAFEQAGEATRDSAHEGRHADGHRVPLRVFHRTMRIGDEIRMVVVAMDISRIQAAERKLLAAKEEAERANQAKTVFLSRMSHELRTPMNAILGFGQILQMDPVMAEDERKESLDEILRAGEHLLNLINEILDLSRIEVGKLSVRREAVSLDDCVQRAVAQTRPLAQTLGVRVEVAGFEARPVLYADRTRLMQILLNLLTNAAKYNRRDGWIRIAVSRLSAPDRWQVDIADSGVGIAESDLARVFDPFERVSAHEHVIEGAGIGLALTRKLVEAMGGEMGVDSRLGEGSRFWFALPVGEVDEAGGAVADRPAA
ncbi:MAG: PAS domain S-box protein [Rhodocyclaceae bacterium]|nr:PAS domain S-box protein [Rhodocyclaceae bacterium]